MKKVELNKKKDSSTDYNLPVTDDLKYIYLPEHYKCRGRQCSCWCRSGRD